MGLHVEHGTAHPEALLQEVHGALAAQPVVDGAVRSALLVLFADGAGVPVLIGVPDLVAEIAVALRDRGGLDEVPGKPPVDHLGGHALHTHIVGHETAAITEHAIALLAGEIAGFEQLVEVLNPKHRLLGHRTRIPDLHRPGIRFLHREVHILGITECSLFRAQGHFFCHRAVTSFLLFVSFSPRDNNQKYTLLSSCMTCHYHSTLLFSCEFRISYFTYE